MAKSTEAFIFPSWSLKSSGTMDKDKKQVEPIQLLVSAEGKSQYDVIEKASGGME